MRSRILSILFSFTALIAFGQERFVKIKITQTIDDSIVTVKRLEIHFEINGKQKKLKTLKDSVIIPSTLFEAKGNLFLKINRNSIKFYNVPLLWNTSFMEWTVGIDHKPFNKEKVWAVKDADSKKLMFYLDYNNGGTMIESK